MILLTVGYKAATLPDVIGRLRDSGVEVVLDMRAVAASRRAGFSKGTLRASLEAEGIAYERLRALGTPKAGREAARKGRVAEMEAIFGTHMETPEAQDALTLAVAIARAAVGAPLLRGGRGRLPQARRGRLDP